MIEIPKPLTLGDIAILVIKRGLLSFGCAFVAWMFMMVFVLLRYYDHPVRGEWFPVWWGIAVFSSVFYIRIYLVLILPIFLLVRPQNYFWSIYISPIFLTTVGFVISKYGFNSQIVDPILENTWLPVTIGCAAMGLVSAMVQGLVAKRMRRAEVASA
jgi:hypothetical protein